MARILLIEDNADLAYGLANNLEIEGYEVAVEDNGKGGLERVFEMAPDLLILDLMMPDIDGYKILRTIREQENDVPVLILSARGEEIDKVQGFRLGADDYVTKPFSVLELLGRVEALLRRFRRGEAPGTPPVVHRFDEIEVDEAHHLVRRDGNELSLAPKEYDLLIALLRSHGAVVSRHDLLREVWGHGGRVLTRTVDTHIAQLRRKLERDPAHPQHILTVRKIGYRLKT